MTLIPSQTNLARRAVREHGGMLPKTLPRKPRKRVIHWYH